MTNFIAPDDHILEPEQVQQEQVQTDEGGYDFYVYEGVAFYPLAGDRTNLLGCPPRWRHDLQALQALHRNWLGLVHPAQDQALA